MIARGEPKTIRDVWYMMKTSHCVHLYYKNIVPFDKLEVGSRTENFTNVEVDWSLTTVYVVEYESKCLSIDRDRRSYSTSSVEISRVAYHDIADFKASPYYNDFLMSFGDGNPDSSWFDDVHVSRNEENGEIQIKCEMGYPRRDFLNDRYRISSRHFPFSLTVDQRYGTIEIETKDNCYEFTVEKIEEMLNTFDMLEKNGISIDKYAGIKIPWKVVD